MRLLRVQVPNFRVLKDVDITFEKDFFPSIFPLGSQNGGGKSTLLQLIFVLLGCSSDPKKLPYLENMLYGVNMSGNSDVEILARFEIWDKEKAVSKEKAISVEFFFCRDDYILTLIESEQSEEVLSDRKDSYKFSTPSTAESYLSKLRPCASELERILGESEKDIKNAKDEREASPGIAIKLLAEVNRISTDLADLTVESNNERWKDSEKDSEKDSVKDLLRICQHHGHRIRRFPTERFDRIYDMIGSPPLRGLRSTLQFIFDFLDSEIQRCETERSGIFAAESHIKRYTSSNNLSYITKHPVEKDKDMEFVLIRKLENISIEDATPFLEKLSNSVFLAAPSTQVFLFLTLQDRRFLFKAENSQNGYYSQLKNVRIAVSNFFTYDFLAVDTLTNAFESARDKDFEKAIEARGEYGKNYADLLKEIEQVLGGKKINVEKDFSGVTFSLDVNGERVELYPEDLSHGELKRLSIYMWLKHRQIKDSIVLMDEIEIALHPDWQYQIVRDLERWEPSNQYILATHSYELCQALTPAHVKALEPRLQPRDPGELSEQEGEF